MENISIYLGGKIHAYTDNSRISGQIKNEFINNCLLFYVEAASQIYKQFPKQKYKTIEKLKFLNPNEVYDATIQSITSLAYKFPNIINDNNLNNLDKAFRLLQCDPKLKNIANEDLELNIFWQIVNQKKLGENEHSCIPLYQLL